MDRVKAAFIINFIQYVEWPVDAFASKKDDVIIGIVGTNPFGSYLKSAVEGRSIKGRRLQIREFPEGAGSAEVASLQLCHVVFLNATAVDEVTGLIESVAGKPVLISAVPSLDTPVCSLQTKRFNDSLSSLPGDIEILTICMDLPMAQKRFCAQEDIERMHVLSDSARREFGARYGILIAGRGLLARAIFVVGRDGRLLYREIVPEVSAHPDYDAALHAIAEAAD